MVFWLLAVGVFLTAVYAFRLIFMTFHGEFKGGVDKELEVRAAGSPAGASNPSPHSKTGLAESPWSMVLPMVFLGIAAIVSGYLANPLGFRSDFLGIDAHWFSNFAVPPAHLPFELEKFNLPIALTSVAVSVAGIGLAAAFYLWPKVSLGKPILPLRGIHRLVSEKYYMDHLFEKQIVSRGFYRVVGGTLDWFDRRIVGQRTRICRLVLPEYREGHQSAANGTCTGIRRGNIPWSCPDTGGLPDMGMRS